MKIRSSWAAGAAAVLLCAGVARGQDNALLPSREAMQLFTRAVQLMESTSLAVPGLARAAAPVLENARQSFVTLKASPGQQHSGLTYSFFVQIRAYLALAETVAKPFPFPEEGRRQFAELRESFDRTESHFRALLAQKEAQLRTADRDNLRRYAEDNARLSPPRPGAPRVVFLGDSITDGWRLNEYFPERDFVNRGISGQITGEMLGRMKADVLDLKPAAVLVLAGTNDIGRGVPVAAIQNNLSMIADLAEFHGIRPIFASVLPISDYHKGANPQFERSRQRPPETIRALNDWLVSFCRQRKYTYVDYFSEMVDAAGFLQKEMADDGLHPNAAGYRVMAPLALAALDKIVPATTPQDSKGRSRRK